jgi:hypothetical protein
VAFPLLNTGTEGVFLNAPGHRGLLVAVALLVSGPVFTPQPVTGSRSGVEVTAIPADIQLVADMREPFDDRDELDDSPNGFVDLYGNEVTDAIATYTFDQAGSLYELHSPQTELPRLGIPKS